jgi:uncharacterized protein HemY
MAEDSRALPTTLNRLLGARKTSEAESLLCERLADQPNDAALHRMLGLVKWRSHDWRGAEASWRSSLANNSLDADVHYFLARLLHRRGRTLPPLGHYFAAVILKPDYLRCQNAIATILARPTPAAT